jgi:hypothetical protein
MSIDIKVGVSSATNTASRKDIEEIVTSRSLAIIRRSSPPWQSQKLRSNGMSSAKMASTHCNIPKTLPYRK